MHLEASFRVELGQIWELQGVHLRTVYGLKSFRGAFGGL